MATKEINGNGRAVSATAFAALLGIVIGVLTIWGMASSSFASCDRVSAVEREQKRQDAEMRALRAEIRDEFSQAEERDIRLRQEILGRLDRMGRERSP